MGESCPIDHITRRATNAGYHRPVPADAVRTYAVSPQLISQAPAYRGTASSVRADGDDMRRMHANGSHWVHALRGNFSTGKSVGRRADLPECKLHHERPLFSGVTRSFDRSARRPSPHRRRVVAGALREQAGPWAECDATDYDARVALLRPPTLYRHGPVLAGHAHTDDVVPVAGEDFAPGELLVL